MGGHDERAAIYGSGMSKVSPINSKMPAEQMSAIARDILEHEAILLEDQDWDGWIDLYDPECVYWVPAWRRDGHLGSNPSRELSLIYYSSRSGLEDRIVRIRSGQSAAGLPMPRTTHLVGNVRVDESLSEAGQIHARASFVTHIFSPRDNSSGACFGSYKIILKRRGADWKISSKTIVLQNDHIATSLDIYCL